MHIQVPTASNQLQPWLCSLLGDAQPVVATWNFHQSLSFEATALNHPGVDAEYRGPYLAGG